MRISTSYNQIARLLLAMALMLWAGVSFAQIRYIGNPLTVAPSASNNGNATPNSFCTVNIGNCFDVDLPNIDTDNNTNDGIIGPFDASNCSSLDAEFVFSSSGDLDLGDDVFLCYRLNLASTYIVASNNNADNNPTADTDCGAQDASNDESSHNYNANATIGGVNNCSVDWQNVSVSVNLYSGPPNLGDGVTFQFRACTDFDDPSEQVTLDEFTISGTGCSFEIILPVELTHFAAKLVNDQVQIGWNSASATNFSHYEIEHSTDGKNFESIYKKMSEGDHLNALFHYWLHKSPVSGNNYYRLKMVDLDGSFDYSEIAVVQWNKGSKISIYPNPTTNYFSLASTNQHKNFELMLLDINGKLLRHWDMDVYSTDHRFALADIPEGLYQLIYSDGQNREVFRLVKQ